MDAQPEILKNLFLWRHALKPWGDRCTSAPILPCGKAGKLYTVPPIRIQNPPALFQQYADTWPAFVQIHQPGFLPDRIKKAKTHRQPFSKSRSFCYRYNAFADNQAWLTSNSPFVTPLLPLLYRATGVSTKKTEE